MIDQPQKAIHFLQLNVTGTAPNDPYTNTPNVTMWQPMTLNLDYTPASVAFAVKVGVVYTP